MVLKWEMKCEASNPVRGELAREARRRYHLVSIKFNFPLEKTPSLALGVRLFVKTKPTLEEQ